MAGHRKGETTYFVPRTKIPLRYSIDWYCERLLPHLGTWQQQRNSPTGDKSSCCANFLNEILPYFVEVLVTDGVYFIQDFPGHPVSVYLQVSENLVSVCAIICGSK